MKTKYLLFALPLIALMTGCTDLEEDVVGSPISGDINSVTISLPEYDNSSVADTRTEITYGGQITFAWAENDTVGIFPVGGGQVEFPISSAAGTTHASFNGGKWALRASEKYAAYFPYNKANVYRDSEHILMDFTGQVQKGVNNTKHLGQYDFLGSPAVNADSEGNLNFQLQRFMKPMDFRLTFPEAVQVKTVRVMADEPIFITQQTMDISGDNPVITSMEESLSRELLLRVEPADEEENVEAVETGDFYLAMAIQDLTPYQLRIQVTTTDNRFFSSDIVSKDLTNSFPGYRTTATLSEGADFIEFADPEVERICLENWDFNHDGGLTYQEAALVESLEEKFIDNIEITSFNELQYFVGLTEVGGFSGCKFLESIVLPENITSIVGGAFNGCEKLTSINIPEGVTSIGAWAFHNCSSLTGEIVIPVGITKIEEQTFIGCSNLTRISLPNSITEVGAAAFADCSSIESINIPEGVKRIRQAAFQNCSSWMGEVTIPEGMKVIEAQAFEGCSRLISITIPESVISIEDAAFSYCSGLTSINIPSQVTVISEATFLQCNSLTSINIPEGVTEIGSQAFDGCRSLSELTIPESVVSIEAAALAGCGFTSITIPQNVKYMGSRVFDNSNGNSLESIIFTSSIPPTLAMEYGPTFWGTSCPIYVPSSSVDAYKEAWPDYADRIMEMGTGGEMPGGGGIG